MGEATQYVLNFKELAEMIVKKQDIHEGVWGIFVRFGINAASVGPPGQEQDLLPAAIVPILEVGIQKQRELTSLAVDAAIVNPRPKRKKKGSSK